MFPSYKIILFNLKPWYLNYNWHIFSIELTTGTKSSMENWFLKMPWLCKRVYFFSTHCTIRKDDFSQHFTPTPIPNVACHCTMCNSYLISLRWQWHANYIMAGMRNNLCLKEEEKRWFFSIKIFVVPVYFIFFYYI